MIRRLRHCALVCAALVIVVTPGLARPLAGVAAPVPWGTVLVTGAQWAGAAASLGDLNVYSNFDGNHDQVTYYGLSYECVELAARFSAIRFGEPRFWNINYAYQMWAAGPKLSVPMRQLANGGATPPQFGDLLIFNKTATNSTGHVAVVAGTGPGYVDIVEQNYNNQNPTGKARLTVTVGAAPVTYTIPDRFGLPIMGWLRSDNAPDGLTGVAGPGGYTVDGYGGLHAFGSAAPTTSDVYWPNWMIARGVAKAQAGNSGYVLDGFGGLHPFGGAPPVVPSAYWGGWDVARGVVLRPDGVSGFVLDAFGGLHPFAPAGQDPPPVPATTGYWPGWDIAAGIAMVPQSMTDGYVMDAYGGLHPFGNATPLSGGPYWPGWRVARGVDVRPDGKGAYIVDAFNGIHALGTAPAVASTGYFPGDDIARGIVVIDQYGGYTITAYGRVRPFGGESEVTYATWAPAAARGIT